MNAAHTVIDNRLRPGVPTLLNLVGRGYLCLRLSDARATDTGPVSEHTRRDRVGRESASLALVPRPFRRRERSDAA